MMAGSVRDDAAGAAACSSRLQRYYMQGLHGRERQGMSRSPTVRAARRGAWPAIAAVLRCSPRSRCRSAAGAQRRSAPIAARRLRRRSRRGRPRASDGVQARRSAAAGTATAARCGSTSTSRGTAGYALGAARAAARPSGELRDLASTCAATRRSTTSRSSSSTRAATTSGGSIGRTSRFRATGDRSRSRSARSSSPGDRRRIARCSTPRRIEFVVAAGRGGGAGVDLRQRPGAARAAAGAARLADAGRAARRRRWPAPTPALAVDGDRATAWRAIRPPGPSRALTLDFGAAARIRRPDPALAATGSHASRYDVQLSDDGVQWRTVRSDRRRRRRRRCAAAARVRGALPAPRAARRARRGPTRSAELEVKDLAFGASPNAFFEALARDAPRGYLSARLLRRAAVLDDRRRRRRRRQRRCCPRMARSKSARGGFSIEPFVVADGRVVDVGRRRRARRSCVDGYLPMPGVTWRRAAAGSCSVTTFAAGDARSVAARRALRRRAT